MSQKFISQFLAHGKLLEHVLIQKRLLSKKKHGMLAMKRPNRGERQRESAGWSPRHRATRPGWVTEKALGEILEDEHEWQSNGPECLKKKFRQMMKCLGLNSWLIHIKWIKFNNERNMNSRENKKCCRKRRVTTFYMTQLLIVFIALITEFWL